MENAHFEAIKAEIDIIIDNLPVTPSGVEMDFGLAGEFLQRGLLQDVEIDMIFTKWQMKAYRGRYVYPNPYLEEYTFTVGQPSR